MALRYSNPNPIEVWTGHRAEFLFEVHGPQPEMATILRAETSREERRKMSYPLDVSVGSIGITATPGSPAGGAGIMGGPMEDSSSPAGGDSQSSKGLLLRSRSSPPWKEAPCS